MKPLTIEWIERAEGDDATTLREVRARRNPNYDAACFHAQQCAEKYLKARLQDSSIPFGKIHDLATLLDRIVPSEPDWQQLREDIEALTAFASESRYPGKSADLTLANGALVRCRRVRQVARLAFGLTG